MTFLFILLVAAMIATVAMLVRGLAIFLLNASNEVRGEGGPSASALKSNKAMQYRIFFQAIAILIVVAILFLAGKN
ncbi:hypothetical protein GCM10009087_46840 [Sphingomonas oligophenolica]|uniref:Twin transmembrane helix small protein n=1 Tax=Sphingomonas oligophenolica TaxID=301154 RepID=A0ABU9Y9D9_9SPHN